ncbi:hypothetical protein QE152_g17030 [Popillia japonica]|uniref:Uncharacterized protein n=1 Tax=Popillia japonica TaxID=7064 RepID=A0AAW1L5C8_POPJA
MEEENLTEHRFIYYEIKVDGAPQRSIERQVFATDWEAYNPNLELRISSLTVTEKRSYEMCTEIMKEALGNSKIEGPKRGKTVPYW